MALEHWNLDSTPNRVPYVSTAVEVISYESNVVLTQKSEVFYTAKILGSRTRS